MKTHFETAPLKINQENKKAKFFSIFSNEQLAEMSQHQKFV